MALSAFATVVWAGSRQLGPVKFWLALVPRIDVPMWLKPILWALLFVIEVVGLVIRHAVLAIRLFANMMAGHIVLAVIVGFILVVKYTDPVFY